MDRDSRIAARCNKAEKAALHALARIEQRRPSETLRELVRRAAEGAGVWPGRERPTAACPAGVSWRDSLKGSET